MAYDKTFSKIVDSGILSSNECFKNGEPVDTNILLDKIFELYWKEVKRVAKLRSYNTSIFDDLVP